MNLGISPVRNINFKANPNQTKTQKSNVTDNGNPISKKGETANLVKATFVGGLALGVRLLAELSDTGEGIDFVFEKAGKKATQIVNKNHGSASATKKLLLTIGATGALIAAGVSAFALLYTMANAKKIAYNSNVNTFQKSKEMDVYIKANQAETSLYTELSEKAKNADEDGIEHLKEQYMKMRMAKNQVPDFVEKQ